MYLTLSISPHYVTGLFVDPKDPKLNSFSFSLPFFKFRNLTKSYWDEVISKAIGYTGADPASVKVVVTSEEETYLSTSGLGLHKSTFELLPSVKPTIVYIGDYKGFSNNIVVPLIINPQDFLKWFPLAQSIDEIEDTFYNRKAYGILNVRDSWIGSFEHALFREKLSFLLSNVSAEFLDKTDDIVLAGEGLLTAGDDERIVLSFLDSAYAFGFWRVYTDPENVLLNLCLLSSLNEKLAGDLEKEVKLVDLAGCLVVPKLKDLTLVFEDGENLEMDLSENSVSVVPLDKNNKVKAKFKLEGKDWLIEINGGRFGLIIDNRDRPLLIGSNAKERVELVDKWYAEINSKVDIEEVREKNKKKDQQTDELKDGETDEKRKKKQVTENKGQKSVSSAGVVDGEAVDSKAMEIKTNTKSAENIGVEKKDTPKIMKG